MTIQKASDRSDGYTWSCSKCKKKLSVRDGSVFYQAAGPPIQKYFALLYMWIFDYDNRHVMRELQFDDKTVTSWFSTFRESKEPPGKIGGEGVFVEFDQTCLTHQKHHRGKKKPGTQVCSFIDSL
jgi:transposase-like protein